MEERYIFICASIVVVIVLWLKHKWDTRFDITFTIWHKFKSIKLPIEDVAKIYEIINKNIKK